MIGIQDPDLSILLNQNTSSECGQSAATCPWLSQSSQKRSTTVLGGHVVAGIVFFEDPSPFSRSQLKISCPGRSQISHTSCPVPPELIVLDDALLSRCRMPFISVLFLEDFLARAALSFNLSTSCSNSSQKVEWYQPSSLDDIYLRRLLHDISECRRISRSRDYCELLQTFASTRVSNSLISLLSYSSL